MTKIAVLLWLSALAPVFLISCASSKIVSDSTDHRKLFPFGVYKHEVKLVLPARGEAPEKKFEFSGIVQLKPDAVHVVVFSFLGTTAFKINEDLKTGEIKTEIYVAQMKRFEPRLKEYYALLREVLIADATPPGAGAHLKWTHTNEKGQPTEMRTVGLDKDAVFKLEDFDANGIPGKFLIEHANFLVEVQVQSYEI
jgi:hypothetical protein